MYIARRMLILTLLIGVLLTSCAGQDSASATPDINAILTAGVGTLAAAIFQTQTAMVPPPSDTHTPTATATATPLTLPSPTASATQLILFVPLATSSITPTGTQYSPTPNPNTLAYGCNNLQLISDETVPAGTVFQPQENFTKTWKVANTGTCDWVYLYHLVFVSGNDMFGEPSRLGKVIPPDKWTQLSIDLQAPKAPGSYSGYWRFADPSGNAFGSILGVTIEVKSPPEPTDTSAPTETPTATPTP